MGIVTDRLQVDAYNFSLQALGYVPLGEYGLRGRRFFKHPQFNLHIFEDTDPEGPRYLRFCAYLNKHPEKVDEYNSLKLSLLDKFSSDVTSYTKGKSAFIKKIDRLALDEGRGGFLTKEVARKQRWTEEEVKEALEVNMHLQFTYFSSYVSSLEKGALPGITLVRSFVYPEDAYNYALGARLSEWNVSQRIDEVSAFFKGLPFSWWVGLNDTPAPFGSFLEKKGFVIREKHQAMVADLEKVSPGKETPLCFQRVLDPRGMRAFTFVLQQMSYMTPHFEEIPPLLYEEGAPYEIYVGFANEVPVTIGVLVLHANVAGVYFLATLPSERKKGFGTAMLLHLLTRAKKKGYFRAILQAADPAVQLYERVGFISLGSVNEYGLSK